MSVENPDTSSGTDGPVGRILATMRRSRKLSGAELAKRVGMSQPKISRLENGVGFPDPEDVGRIARELGAEDDEIRRLVELAERAHNRMTDWRPFPTPLASKQRGVAHWESDAATLRQFEPAVICGLLQTSGYARAVLSTFQELILLDAEPAAGPSVAEAVSARMRRQEVLADEGKSFRFILSETALGNRICPSDEMPSQIHRLRQVARQDNVSLAIIPADALWRVPPMHGFQLFDEKTVTVDLFNTGLESHGRADARMYRQVFDWLADQAVHDIDPILDRYLDRYVDLLRAPGRG
ncbi:helix-turn-helix transcriptional regulator [Virgisporangium ochraceum]|uniref:Transcriptional regulator n=1 Tax=Virgisporangium ochraceum TaxID=65505 RepID=A0A8J4A1B0_9ACTN|nr:helix-turn-helix transcriptional regulator [Virgisporangium ochraceum]GIJ73999.1 transcriptional regulator [Virgisporangium ochraceum]